jgi:hypothetical protein
MSDIIKNQIDQPWNGLNIIYPVVLVLFQCCPEGKKACTPIMEGISNKETNKG